MDIETKGTKGDFEMKINLSRGEAKWVADEILSHYFDLQKKLTRSLRECFAGEAEEIGEDFIEPPDFELLESDYGGPTLFRVLLDDPDYDYLTEIYFEDYETMLKYGKAWDQINNALPDDDQRRPR